MTKYLFFRYYAWLALLIAVALIALQVFGATSISWQVTVTAMTAVLSFVYFVQKQKIEELRLFKELFTKCNEAYEQLNEELAAIGAREPGETLEDEEVKTLVSYFNLCGEELLYYREGFIYPLVWESWWNGMRYYYAVPRICEFWDAELKGNSYYGTPAKWKAILE